MFSITTSHSWVVSVCHIAVTFISDKLTKNLIFMVIFLIIAYWAIHHIKLFERVKKNSKSKTFTSFKNSFNPLGLSKRVFSQLPTISELLILSQQLKFTIFTNWLTTNKKSLKTVLGYSPINLYPFLQVLSILIFTLWYLYFHFIKSEVDILISVEFLD